MSGLKNTDIETLEKLRGERDMTEQTADQLWANTAQTYSQIQGLTPGINEAIGRLKLLTLAQGSPCTCPLDKGCWHCCKEPVYASDREVMACARYVQGGTGTSVGFGWMRGRSQMWFAKFSSTPFMFSKGPRKWSELKGYIESRMICPFLTDSNSCIVYEVRPLACRLHMACGPKENCANIVTRRTQRFIESKELNSMLMRQIVGTFESGYVDHLGIVLHNLLFGTNYKTPSRVSWDRESIGRMRRFAEESKQQQLPIEATKERTE